MSWNCVAGIVTGHDEPTSAVQPWQARNHNRRRHVCVGEKRSGIPSDGMVDVRDAVTKQETAQTGGECTRQMRALVDETGVDLDQRGAGTDLLVRVLRSEDATDTDDGKAPTGDPIEQTDDLGRALTQGAS